MGISNQLPVYKVDLSNLTTNIAAARYFNVRSAVLALGDVLAVLFSLFVGWLAAGAFRWFIGEGSGLISINLTTVKYLSIVITITLAIMLSCSLSWGHYSRGKPFWPQAREQFKIVAYIIAATTLVLFTTKENFSRPWLVSFWSSLVVTLPLMRVISTHYMIRMNKWYKPAIIVGSGENARNAASALQSDIYLGIYVAGFVSQSNGSVSADSEYPAQRNIADWTDRFKGEAAPLVVFAFDTIDEFTTHRDEIEAWMTKNSNVTVVPPLTGLPMHEAEVLSIFKHDSVILRLQNNLKKPWSNFLKRAFDIIVGSLLALLALPALLTIYLLVARDGGNPIFAHKRIGKNGKTFPCYKFRTMVTDAEQRLRELIENDAEAKREWETTFKLKNDVRVTPLGQWLRKTSLDEAPQILNVLRGDMSLVGPRPIVSDEICRYGDDYTYYTNAKPGLTGLWQISGRSDIDYAERIQLDKWYVRNWSIWQDIVILFGTVPIVLNRKGAY